MAPTGTSQHLKQILAITDRGLHLRQERPCYIPSEAAQRKRRGNNDRTGSHGRRMNG